MLSILTSEPLNKSQEQNKGSTHCITFWPRCSGIALAGMRWRHSRWPQPKRVSCEADTTLGWYAACYGYHGMCSNVCRQFFATRLFFQAHVPAESLLGQIRNISSLLHRYIVLLWQSREPCWAQIPLDGRCTNSEIAVTYSNYPRHVKVQHLWLLSDLSFDAWP